MTRAFDRMRRDIANLSRPDLRVLAFQVGIDRDALTDFADIAIALEPATMERLESWHADFALRATLNDPAWAKHLSDLPAAAGVDHASFTVFAAGQGDLPDEAKTKLRAHLAHGGPPPKQGEALPAMTASAQPPAAMRRRAFHVARFRALPDAEQERLLGMAREFEPA